jgi:large subunit ribosomal protein L29
MKIKELREKTEKDLQKMLAAEREHVRELRFKVSQRQLKNLREARNAKKTIAQILTLKKEKELKSVSASASVKTTADKKASVGKK